MSIMTTTIRPMSSSSGGRMLKGVKSDGPKPDMWSSLLDSVASGERLPEKQVILLGGSSETQKDFINLLGSKSTKVVQDRQKRAPPIANDFALGYTYQEVLDADQDYTIARLSIYTLQDSATGFSSLLQPLLTPATIPDTLLVILLDWSEPWNWITQLRDWIRLLHESFATLNDESKKIMQEIMHDWEQQRRGGTYDMGLSNAPQEASLTIPLGAGEWDAALGLPLCVVCHNADKIDVLERDHGWREDDFDRVLQFLRTILLKHGASLVYTSNSMPNSAPLLIQYSLGVRSVLKQEPLKHNIIDRDRILIPPNWDSWGKIKVLREGFDIEGTSGGWDMEIQPKSRSAINSENQAEVDDATVLMQSWQESVKNPNKDTDILSSGFKADGQETRTIVMQEFLADQIKTIERLKVEEEEIAAKRSVKTSADSGASAATADETSKVTEHVGPIQFNMGGINLDAEDMLNHIKERGNTGLNSPGVSADGTLPTTSNEAVKQQQKEPEGLATFFESLIKRSGGSGAGTPPRKTRGT